jgi:hypothetical protein
LHLGLLEQPHEKFSLDSLLLSVNEQQDDWLMRKNDHAPSLALPLCIVAVDG